MIMKINYNGTIKQFNVAQISDVTNLIADTYSNSSTYAIGDVVVQNGKLYKCITAISTAESWTAAHWEEITVKDYVDDNKGSGGGSGAVDSVNGKTGAVVLDASDVGALPDNTAIPSKTSDLTNDSGFITNATVPTATTSKSGTTTTLTVTDKNGTTTS